MNLISSRHSLQEAKRLGENTFHQQGTSTQPTQRTIWPRSRTRPEQLEYAYCCADRAVRAFDRVVRVFVPLPHGVQVFARVCAGHLTHLGCFFLNEGPIFSSAWICTHLFVRAGVAIVRRVPRMQDSRVAPDFLNVVSEIKQ